MNIDMSLQGIISHQTYSWRGTACSINRRSTISRGKIIKTKRYRDFCGDLDNTFFAQWAEFYQGITIENNAVLIVQLHRGVRKNHSFIDVDAIIKPTQDALQKCGAIKDDALILAPIFFPIPPNKETPYDNMVVTLLELGSDWTFDSVTS